MRAAWSLSRTGAARFGGRPAQYVRESLRMVWADYLSAVRTRVERSSDSQVVPRHCAIRATLAFVSAVPETDSKEESTMRISDKTVIVVGFVVLVTTIPLAAFAGVSGSAFLILTTVGAGLAAFASVNLADRAARHERDARLFRYRLGRL